MYEEGRLKNSNENGPINSLERSGKTQTATVSLICDIPVVLDNMKVQGSTVKHN